MKLEVGKYYKTRDGRKAGPIAKKLEWNPTYPFKGFIGGVELTWTEDGLLCTLGDSPYDLVEEWKDEPKLWKDMTDEEKGALLLAHHEGKIIEYYTKVNPEWVKVYNPPWCDNYAYRVKPGAVIKSDSFGIVRNGCGYNITFITIDGEPDCSSVRMSKA